MGSKANATITLSSYRDTKSVTRYYQLNSSIPSKPTAKPPSGWSIAEPTYTSGSTTSLYYCDLIEFSDGTYAYSAVNKSSSYQAAKEAYTAAQNAQNSIDNLQVGGRNLAFNSKWISDTSSTGNVWGKIGSRVNVKQNETYTFAAYRNGVRTTGTNYGYAYAYAYDSDGNRVGSGDYMVTSGNKGYCTKTITESNIVYLMLYVGPKNFVVGDDYRIKFELGNTPTDWTPAPEDAIDSVDVEYYLSTSATSLTGGSWSTIAPTWVNGKYMWSRTVLTNGADIKTYSPSQNGVCIAGATGSTGSTGAAGKGIKSIVEQYYKSTSATSQTGGSWSGSYPGWENGKYIWTRSIITYTDNTTTTTTAICVTGSTGATGATGATGKGISNINEYYQVSTSNTTSPSSWTSTPPNMTATNKYLWNYEKITYTDGTTKDTTKRVIGVYGDKGNSGTNGMSIGNIINYYLATNSSSGVTISTSGWTTTVQSVSSSKKYLWNYEVIKYSDGTTASTSAPCIIGAYGDTGAKGDKGSTGNTGPAGPTGNGIKSTSITYQAGSSGTSAPTGSWVSSPPTTSASAPYLWTRTIITYTNNATSTSYSVGSTPESIAIGGRNYIRYGKGDSSNGIFSNFNTVTDDYSEHTLTSKKQYSNVNIAAGFVLGCRDYIVGEKVTWSYDIMYTAWNFPEGSNRGEFWFGQRYTNIRSGDTGTGLWCMVTAHNLPVVGTDGCELNKWYHVEKTMTIPEQASDNIGEAASIQFYNSNADVEASFTFRLKNVKLEYGNRATDWTPALEDVATVDSLESTNQAMDELSDLMNARVEATEMAIGDIEGLISTLVVDANGGSLMKQTSDGWIFSMGETLSKLQTAVDDLKTLEGELDTTSGNVDALQNVVSGLETLTSYIRITTDGDEPQIELGNKGSFKVLITNTAIKFMDGTSVPAYVSNQSLKIGRAEVEDELVFGGFAFTERANGNMGLIWKGE